MREQLAKINNWFNRRSENERVLIFILALVFLYIVWRWLVISPLKAKQEELRFATTNLENQTNLIQEQINSINSIVTTKTFREALVRARKMMRQEGQLRGQLSNVSALFISPKSIPHIIKEIIAAQSSQIDMTALTSSPGDLWLPEALKDAAFLNQAIYRYGIQLEFRSNYFNAIEYLTRLEKLKWNLYWNSLEYKVTKYPDAIVTVKFHILSDQKHG